MPKQNKTGDRVNSIFSAMLLLVLAGLLAWGSVRYPLVSDWTRQGRHSLSEASIQLLNKTQGEIEITAYAREQPELRERIRSFIYRYQRSKEDISLQFVNPDTVPDEVRNLGIKNGELVIRYQGKTEHVRAGREQEFTNALQRLLRGTERWLAFIEGHGERSPLGTANHDISEWSRQLNSRGFKYQPINLVNTQTIPDNTSALVIAGPLVSYLHGEVEIILNYLARGGNLLWLHEPGKMQGLEAIANYLGIKFLEGSVVDISWQLGGNNEPTITLIHKQLYGAHPALSGFSLTTLFPMAAAISFSNTNDWTIQPLLMTGDLTWIETGGTKGEMEFNQDADIKGPLTIAISLERELQQDTINKQQRILVIGDGDFISNTYINNSGNLELGIRLINWLVHEDSFISIPARTVEDADLQLTQLTSIIIGFGFLIFLPLSLLAMGGLIWWRRKNL